MVREEYNHSRPVSALIRDWLLYSKASGGGGILKTVTGNPISVSDALAARIKSLTVEMSPIQEGSGDPSPDNIRPITGRESVTVIRTGVNLFDKDNPSVKNGYIDTSAQKIVSSTSHRLIYIPCKPNTTYTVSKVAVVSGSSDRLFIGWTKTVPAANVDVYDIHGTSSGFIVGTRYSFSTQTGADAQYVVVWISRSGEYADSIATTQIEVGSTASDYEPYTADTVTIQLGTTVYGGMAEIISGQGQRDYALATFTGAASEAWSLYQTYPNHFQINVSPGNAKNNGVEINAISNAYPGRAGMSNNTSGVLYGVFSADGNRIRIKDVDCSTVEEFKAKLQTISGGLQVCYKLATPQTLTLTPEQLSTLNGQNNVWSDGDDISMTYKAASE